MNVAILDVQRGQSSPVSSREKGGSGDRVGPHKGTGDSAGVAGRDGCKQGVGAGRKPTPAE